MLVLSISLLVKHLVGLSVLGGVGKVMDLVLWSCVSWDFQY